MGNLEQGKSVFDTEIKALEKTRDCLGEVFLNILDMIVDCKGKVILTGMGKPGHIAKKLAATFASLGTPSFYLHPGEAMHGDLGMVSESDLVIVISYSGESDEVITIIPNIKLIGAKIVGITGNAFSTLAQLADIVQILPQFEEACHLGLAPTSSTTAVLCYGDALAVVASNIYGFRKDDFGKFHPAGTLGKKLIIRVRDLMAKGVDNPKIQVGALMMEAISEMTHKGLGVVSVVDETNHLLGIITDGDLRRMIEKHTDFYTTPVELVMVKTPFKTTSDILAVQALNFIRQHKINNLPIVDDDNVLIGTLTWQMIIKAGIVA